MSRSKCSDLSLEKNIKIDYRGQNNRGQFKDLSHKLKLTFEEVTGRENPQNKIK